MDLFVESDAEVGTGCGRLGKNDTVARLKPAEDLDGGDGAAAQLHAFPRGMHPIRLKHEKIHRAAFLAEGGTAHVDHVVEPLQLDYPVDRKIRARPGRQGSVQPDIDRDRPVLHRRIDPHHFTFDEPLLPAAGIDLGQLA